MLLKNICSNFFLSCYVVWSE